MHVSIIWLHIGKWIMRVMLEKNNCEKLAKKPEA
jgi:hypothetical protein